MNSYSLKQALELFLALFALYSPLAALPSYLPTLGRMHRKEHVRLAVALFVNVAVISLVSLWIGEKLLVLLGIGGPVGSDATHWRRALGWSGRAA